MQVTRRSDRASHAASAACWVMPVKRERYQPLAVCTSRWAFENWPEKRRLMLFSQSRATASSRKAPTWTVQRPAGVAAAARAGVLRAARAGAADVAADPPFSAAVRFSGGRFSARRADGAGVTSVGRLRGGGPET